MWLWILAGILLLVILLLLYKALDQSLSISRYRLEFDTLPTAFDGFRAFLVSDLHSKRVQGLEQTLRQEIPDAIFCTGDIFDGVRMAETALNFLDTALSIAPVYFVSGNHEHNNPDWPLLKQQIEQMGVILMEDRSVQLKKQDQQITITGLQDPGRACHLKIDRLLENLLDSAAKLGHPQPFTILLFHRANLLDHVKELGYDLILSGHVHGGQWRFFGRGVAGPGNERRVELLPKYDAGRFDHHHTTMIVSRGLGDQMRIPRLFNPPELVMIELLSSQRQAFPASGNQLEKTL